MFQIRYAKQVVDQKIQNGQEKLMEMWEVWKKSQPVEQNEADGEGMDEVCCILNKVSSLSYTGLP